MHLKFLGTATSQGVPVIGCNCNVCTSSDPKNIRSRSSILLVHEQKNYVIDAGPDFRSQMLIHKIDQLEAVILTHEHSDHTSGLDDLRPFIFRQEKDMPIYALPRVIEDVKTRFAYAFAPNPYPGIPRFDMREFDFDQTLLIDGMALEVIKVLHGKLPIAGFRIGDTVYITDAKYIDQKEIKKIKDCDTLIINALHHDTHFTHLNLTEALALIQEINPGRTFLTHVSHKMGDYKEVEKLLPQNVSFAYDGLILDM